MKKILYIALAVAAMVSCQKNEEATGGNKVAARFSDAAISRATATAWETGDAIGVYMVAKDAALSDANAIDGAKNIKHTVAAAGATGLFTPATPSETIYFPDNGSAVDFYAYYPYQAAMANGVYKINVATQSTPSAIDLLAAKQANKNQSAPTVSLAFSHQLSKLSLTLSAGDGFTAADLAGMTVKIKGLPVAADYNIATGAVSGAGAATDITAKTNAAGTSAEAIIIPQSTVAAGSVQVVFGLTNGTELHWNLPVASLLSGSDYQHTLRINRADITLVAQNITNWTTNATVEGTADQMTPMYSVGDYYPDPNVTFSAPGIVLSGTAPVGIVFWLDSTDSDYMKASGNNPAKGLKGKIMSLDEGWGDWDNAQLWVSTKALPQGMTWNAPVISEYWDIYGMWNGSYDVQADLAVRAAINKKLTDAGGTEISAAEYWAVDMVERFYRYFDFDKGRNISIGGKEYSYRVRTTSAF